MLVSNLRWQKDTVLLLVGILLDSLLLHCCCKEAIPEHLCNSKAVHGFVQDLEPARVLIVIS
jgi:hypothetical protein